MNINAFNVPEESLVMPEDRNRTLTVIQTHAESLINQETLL